MLNGFKPYYMASGTPGITFTKNGVGVNKATVAKLDNSKFVRILFDYSGKRMAIVKCEEGEPAATEFSRSEKAEGIRWNTRDLSATIMRITSWAVENGEKYSIDGVYTEEDCALVFDFNDAVIS